MSAIDLHDKWLIPSPEEISRLLLEEGGRWRWALWCGPTGTHRGFNLVPVHFADGHMFVEGDKHYHIHGTYRWTYGTVESVVYRFGPWIADPLDPREQPDAECGKCGARVSIEKIAGVERGKPVWQFSVTCPVCIPPVTQEPSLS